MQAEPIPDANRTSHEHSANARKPLKVALPYPWLSPLLCSILAAAFIYLQQNSEAQLFLSQHPILAVLAPAVALALLFATLLLDFVYFRRKQQTLNKKIGELEEELSYAWQSRKKLQQQTHLYSDHADKLKRFISDKLIEQIEYDEKFLHFKSIAAEIRHNGVISYDIVRAALEQAIASEVQIQQVEGSLADTHRFGLPNNPNSGPQQALQAMKYLWDLLDLSTADNIALHIGNYLIECEELYYQYELSRSNSEAPRKPPAIIFSANIAAIKAMGPYLKSDELDRLVALSAQTGPGYQVHSQLFENSQFRIWLNALEPLLGNENHIILLLENLVKNAQFFSGKSTFKQATDRIAMKLEQAEHAVVFSVYNRGPHIKQEEQQQIFQLGYSTRRAREHHGKGLGLFFVSEIVKGYLGRIEIENINNKESTYSVRIALKDKTVLTKVIERKIQNERPLLRELGQQELATELKWATDSAVVSVEVSSTRFAKTYVFDEFDEPVSQVLDPESPFSPEWTLEVHSKARSHAVTLGALDIKGALFKVMLPTAAARQNSDAPLLQGDL